MEWLLGAFFLIPASFFLGLLSLVIRSIFPGFAAPLSP
jgi:hypothetical protein